jgi:succinyl-CoA synthetase alpha subunit
MKGYGTNIVAGVTPGKQGQSIEGIPVYDSVENALKEHKVEFSIIFVPAKFAKDAAFEALNNNLNLVIITEGIPVHDTLKIMQLARQKNKIVIGPNCPGIISPEESKLGIMPSHIFKKGNVGVVSRSGTLTYEIINELTKNNLGQSTVIGIGGDPVIGIEFIDVLKLFEQDKETEKIVLIGEIGGNLEERAAAFIKDNITKKVIAYIAGRTAPKERKMGHAGAIISGKTGTAESKIKAFEAINMKVAKLPSEIPELLSDL